MAHIALSLARPSSESLERDSVELPPLSDVLPLFIDHSQDSSSAENQGIYVDTSVLHNIKKRDLVPVSIVSEVKHESIAVDNDSFEAAESSHIFRPIFRQRSIVEDRLRRRAATESTTAKA